MMKLKPTHAVVGAWAAANLVLALVHLGFHPRSLPFFLYIGGTAVVAGFGLAVLLAVRAGRVGTQQRQPRRAGAAVLAVIGVALGLAGFAYGWWLSALAFYPLALAAWVLRGERLPRGVRPWPVALDGAEPARGPRLVYHGSSIGNAVPVPEEHPAHGPPVAPPPRPQPSATVQRGIWVVVLASVARGVLKALRGRRDG
jgi:hypothetical protein